MLDVKNIQYQIAQGHLEKALDTLLQDKQLQNTDSFNDLILLKARYTKMRREASMGITTSAQQNMQHNQIVYAVLELVKSIQKDKSLVQESISNQELTPDKKEVTKILFLASNPIDTARLSLDKEIREIEQVLRQSKHRDKFAFISKSAVQIADLQQYLLEEEPHIVHFSGHGTKDGIFLHDHDGSPELVGTEALADLFKLFKEQVACVFLNSCYSEPQGLAINESIPYVIGMKNVINDRSAIRFSSSFYMALGAGREIEFCFELAKNAIDLSSLPDSDIPILLDQSIPT